MAKPPPRLIEIPIDLSVCRLRGKTAAAPTSAGEVKAPSKEDKSAGAIEAAPAELAPGTVRGGSATGGKSKSWPHSARRLGVRTSASSAVFFSRPPDETPGDAGEVYEQVRQEGIE